MRRFILAGIVLLVTSVGVTAAGAQRQPILARMSDAPAADPNKPPPTRPCPDPPCFDPSSGRTPAAFLNWVGRDVTAFWRKRVEELPLPYRWVRGRQLVVAPRQKQRSKCYGAVTSTTPLSYCAKDAPPTVLLPLDKARTVVLRQKTWDGWRRKGDFALAYVVAHEWAHHLQKVLNLLQDRELRSMKIELQADCLAGVWSHSVWARNLLGPGDIKQALALARLVGDAPGSPKNDKNAHGSATEREMWFNRGYETGKASNCIVA